MTVYADHVLDHYKEQRGRGTVPNANVTYHDSNPLCGDKITVQLAVSDSGKLTAARHNTSGCAVSQAGASMLFEQLEGKTRAEVLAMPKDVVLAQFGTELSVSRVKCALLAYSAVKKALVQHASMTGAVDATHEESA